MSINLQLQERDALLLVVALGLLVIDSGQREAEGESTMLRGKAVTPAEAVQLIGLIRNAMADGPAPTVDPEVLSDREKFLIGGALGALFAQMDASIRGPEGAALVAQLKQEVLVAADKLQLRQGALNGAGEFLRGLE
ncbi:hypothetical protein [Stenotrophomonas phage BUCTxx99]|nr:hypothetical protein [Stenotrophomonas phage BUCTxx99]